MTIPDSLDALRRRLLKGMLVALTALAYQRLPFAFSSGVVLGCLYGISVYNLVHFFPARALPFF